MELGWRNGSCDFGACGLDHDWQDRRPEESVAAGVYAFQNGHARICPGTQGTPACKDWLHGYDTAADFVEFLRFEADIDPYDSYVAHD